jgi:hypothetical protein
VICETNIERLLQQFEPRVDPQQTPLPPDNKGNRSGAKRRKKIGHLENPFDLRTEAYKLFGVDVTQIPGLETNVLSLFSEVGRDLSRSQTASHFISWLSLCPDNDISGGRVLWRGCAKSTTAPVKSSAWPRSPYIEVPRPWENIYGVSKASSTPPAPSPPPPARSPPCSTPSSPAKSNSTTLSGTPPTLSVSNGSKLDSRGKLVDSVINSFRCRSLPPCNRIPSTYEVPPKVVETTTENCQFISYINDLSACHRYQSGAGEYSGQGTVWKDPPYRNVRWRAPRWLASRLSIEALDDWTVDRET